MPVHAQALRAARPGAEPASRSGTAALSSAFARTGASSGGQALDKTTQREMSARFGHDFSRVRIHTDARAEDTAAALGAEAYATGHDIAFGAGKYLPGSPETERLLAHELTHVVQQERHGPGDPTRSSDRGDASEREAESVSTDVTAGRDVEVQARPGAAVARGVLGWLEDKAEGAYDAVSDVASDAYDTVSDVASDAWDGAKSLGSAAWDETKDIGSDIYGGMKTAAGYVKRGEEAFEGGVDWAEDKVTGAADWVADKADGIPVLGSLAHGGAWLVDKQAQLAGGVMKGAGSLVGGVGQMIADPVDAAKGIEAMGEHIPTELIGLPNPLKAAHGLLNVATGDESWGDFAHQDLNPVQSLKDDAQFGSVLAHGIAAPYQKEFAEGKGVEAAGRGIFDIASLLSGAGEAADAAKLADIADVAKGADVADAARAGEMADAAKAGETAGDAAKASGGGIEPPGGVPPSGGGGHGPQSIEEMIQEELDKAEKAQPGFNRHPGQEPLDPNTITEEAPQPTPPSATQPPTPASEPAASEPAASEPAASEPAASEPAASEPAASDRDGDWADDNSGGERGEKGKSFRGGKKSSRDNWYGYNDRNFQRWWHREGKQGQDIDGAEDAQRAYEQWVYEGKPRVK